MLFFIREIVTRFTTPPAREKYNYWEVNENKAGLVSNKKFQV